MNFKNQNNMNTEEKITAIENQFSIRELVDNYAFFADAKETDKQVALFADDYKLEVYYDSTSQIPTQTIHGKDNLKQLFVDSLSPFSKTMHFNGQSSVTFVSETEAEGLVYCRAFHYNNTNNQETLMVAAIKYLDKYKKNDDKWYFAERKLLVQWMENK